MDNNFAERKECAEFVSRFAEGLSEYLSVPNTCIRIINLKEGSAAQNLMNAIVPDEDGFWHVGLAVKPKKSAWWTSSAALFHLSVRRERGVFVLKIKESNEASGAARGRKQRPHRLCDFITN
ncbi:MAG: hypothetical protein ACE5IR_00045 [bacterium]